MYKEITIMQTKHDYREEETSCLKEEGLGVVFILGLMLQWISDMLSRKIIHGFLMIIDSLFWFSWRGKGEELIEKKYCAGGDW